MLDRYVGIAGLIIGILALVAPYRWHDLPVWLTSGGVYIAIGLIGAAAGLFYSQTWGDATEDKAVRDVSMFLQFSDDHTVPKEIRQTNVLSWYALFTESIYVQMQDVDKNPFHGFSVPPRWSIFILFKGPAKYRQMLANCAGSESVKCAVQTFNDRYAIITVTGDVTHAGLEISVIQ